MEVLSWEDYLKMVPSMQISNISTSTDPTSNVQHTSIRAQQSTHHTSTSVTLKPHAHLTETRTIVHVTKTTLVMAKLLVFVSTRVPQTWHHTNINATRMHLVPLLQLRTTVHVKECSSETEQNAQLHHGRLYPTLPFSSMPLLSWQTLRRRSRSMRSQQYKSMLTTRCTRTLFTAREETNRSVPTKSHATILLSLHLLLFQRWQTQLIATCITLLWTHVLRMLLVNNIVVTIMPRVHSTTTTTRASVTVTSSETVQSAKLTTHVLLTTLYLNTSVMLMLHAHLLNLRTIARALKTTLVTGNSAHVSTPVPPIWHHTNIIATRKPDAHSLQLRSSVHVKECSSETEQTAQLQHGKNSPTLRYFRKLLLILTPRRVKIRRWCLQLTSHTRLLHTAVKGRKLTLHSSILK